MSAPQVIFVDDEEHLRFAARQSLELEGLEVACHSAAKEALGLVHRTFPGVLVTDIRMEGMDGLALMQAARERDPDLPVILLTGHGDVDLAVRSMQDGAYDFIEKPFAPARLIGTVRRALEKRRLTLENRRLRSAVTAARASRLPSGRSPLMAAFRERLLAVAEVETDVLIVGETGSGKEVAARALHEASPRAEAGLVHINCAALPADLIESELFGHEAGAFPGATRTRYGKFEHARGGTVFLDEIDSLALPLQAKLLHAVQNRQITRLGSNDPVALDVRFVAASKTDLEAASAGGRFRGDLLYRLNVVTLQVPPLAARREDIPDLFAELVTEAAHRLDRPTPDVAPSVLEAMAARDWPGNVRQLRNAAERYVLGFEGEGRADVGHGGLAERMAAHEKGLIAACIAAHGGSLKAAYEALGISRKALYDKMQRHGLRREDFRETG